MLHFSRAKIVMIALACAFGMLAALPNLLPKDTLAAWPSFLPRQQLNYGLDLRGGAHLLLEMDRKELVKDWLATVQGDVRKRLRDAKIRYTGLGVAGDLVRVSLVDGADKEKALTELRALISPIGGAILTTTGSDLEVGEAEGGALTIGPTDVGLRQRLASAADAAIEVVRRRIDAVGTTEPNIVRQGENRILVQVPGFDDTAKLKALIGQTAKLTFHDVHPTISAEEAQATRIPIGFRLYPSQENPQAEYLLEETPVVYGEDLADAQAGFDSRTNEPIISFRFNQRAARLFGDFTVKNVGRPFAIVLDNGVVNGKRDVKVLSAPVIREPILGGSGQISGGFSVQEATNLAIQLRSGALPTTLTIIEERTVGPALGADSIEAGTRAFMIGAIATIAMTITAYGTFGVFAAVGLLVNAILIVGIMSLIGATLTLPGIAGLVLTIGMAVDANVLIFERIREEIRNGKPPMSAIDAGFERAMITIADSQLTTLVAAFIMFWLGSGPIRGFAVTLSIGIFTSVFTAVTVTRLLAALWVANKSAKAGRRWTVPI
ncbi:MAG: protein translocase subunit SecD [Hyphomicrobiaceae bacterium]|nr:protein translocase subunit SecD [Hyphomicrobiaceae bacterium]